jgi:hypothetical protein
VDNAQVDEIKAAITAELASQITTATAATHRALCPVCELADDQITVMFSEIAAFIRLTGGGWEPRHRQEFIDQASTDLADIPASLLAPALVEARRRVTWPREFVPWVHAWVEAPWAKLKVEHERLSALSVIWSEK